MSFIHTTFFNSKNRQLRSGWQILIFFLLMQIVSLLIFALATGVSIPAFGKPIDKMLEGLAREGVFRSIGLVGALIASWFCATRLSLRSFASVGLSFHPGWWRDFVIGITAAYVMVSLIAFMQWLGGGTNFAWQPPPLRQAVISLGFIALVVFIAASLEEVMFRGFPLQILAGNLGMVSAALIMSLAFGLIHTFNPNRTFFSILNTIFAGLWLSAAYFKTRSLWLAIGLHMSWNFFLGSFYGLPVSGLDWFSKNSLLSAVNTGPAWFTGASYGPEGGLSATVVLALSTAWLIKTDWLRASPEMGENRKDTKSIKDL